ncbi:MAG: XRE family transcriptional regulator [Alphaproteobacteria bacterium]|nr:MAG: XRE family transcriptional regulator [Alphaproteobacteria bacterium]
MANSSTALRDTFAKRLRTLRLAAGLSQRELGRRIGLSEEVVSSRVTRYERGTSEPDFATASKLAKALGVPLSSLVADTDLLADLISTIASLPVAEQRKLLAGLRSHAGRAGT